MKDIPIYTDSIETAHNNDELNEYRESLTANLYCKDAIQNSIRENFDGMHLNTDFIANLYALYGEERMNYVLASTVQTSESDGRFNPDNKAWSK